MPGNIKLQDRGGYNAADKPGFNPFNSFFGAREGVNLTNLATDIEVIPTPPPGIVRILDDSVPQPASFGQVAGIANGLAGSLIYQDIAGNEQTLETAASAAGSILATTKNNTSSIPHLVNGERIIFRSLVAGNPGEGVFLGAWKDTDLSAARADLTTAIQTVAAPPAGKTWSALIGSYLGNTPFDDIAVWNFDSVVHNVDFYLNDGSQDILIDTVAAIPAAVGAVAGEGIPTNMGDAGLVIPDGCSLRASIQEAIATGPCRVLIPFFELNASKLDPRAPTF